MPGQPLYPVDGSGSPPPSPVPTPPRRSGGISTELVVVLSIAGLILVVLLILFVNYLNKLIRGTQRPADSQRRNSGHGTLDVDSGAVGRTEEGNGGDQRSENLPVIIQPPADSASPPPQHLISSTIPEGIEGNQRTQNLPIIFQRPADSASPLPPSLISSAIPEGIEGDQRTQNLPFIFQPPAGSATPPPPRLISSAIPIIKNCHLEELRELGSGTFGTVYLGRWRGTDVAIKRIHNCFVGDAPEQRDEFWNEVGRLASLHHPNVVAFYGVVLDGPAGSVATVTEYVADGSLRRALQVNRKMFDKRRRLLVAMDIAICMEYLHDKKIVHFDLKSDNLLLDLRDPRRPVCKVCDLGLSKARFRTLVSGGVRGTLPWMAPELLDGSPVSEKVDVYSFGIVMWELLTGKEPYENLYYGTILGGIVNNTLRPDVPESCEPWWRSLMEQSWSNQPSHRPGFTEIASRLRAVASSTATA